MKSTRSLVGWLLPFLAAAVWSTAAFAQSGEIDSDAVQLLRRTTDYLAGMKQFKVDTETTIEAVLPTGQKLQFGHHVAVTVQRPNKLRADRIGELVNQTFYYDGKSLSMNLPDQKYYAIAAAPPTLEAMLDFARNKLAIIAPGADLVYQNAFERFNDGLTSAFVVGKAVVGGVRCDHIAFRNPEVDWQIWIQEGDKPQPRKFVVTSKRMPESPQFVVVLGKWDPAPKLTDATFSFVPPKGSRRIEFLPVAASAPQK